ncbi:alkylhydroperoxidase AhpD family core domain-containing protein [Amycolatopsis marina]|uniref:Alkylhydroperoxidase AhpD family core domain-containing protein n=1 Tax=Amycolatopsis marina TaxID=490629 RepID=A0A1I0YTB4_9PSEU|nr:alkylhydroperoxidase AhpD family core domain-containing protein [Amycolatopsis marina]
MGNVIVVTKRIQITSVLPEAYKSVASLHKVVQQAAADAGLAPTLLELVRIRASQINGCSYCIDTHSRDALKLGESQRRLLLLPAWRESGLFTEAERVALALTEEVTRLSETRDVPDALYEEATQVFTEEQYVAVMWTIGVINMLNRFGVPSHKPLPEQVS